MRSVVFGQLGDEANAHVIFESVSRLMSRSELFIAKMLLCPAACAVALNQRRSI